MNVQKWRWDLKVRFHLKQKDFEIFPIEVVNIEYMPFFLLIPPENPLMVNRAHKNSHTVYGTWKKVQKFL